MDGFILVGEVDRCWESSYQQADGGTVTEYNVSLIYKGGKTSTKGDPQENDYVAGEIVAVQVRADIGRTKDGREFTTWRRVGRIYPEQMQALFVGMGMGEAVKLGTLAELGIGVEAGDG